MLKANRANFGHVEADGLFRLQRTRLSWYIVSICPPNCDEHLSLHFGHDGSMKSLTCKNTVEESQADRTV